MKKRRAFRNLEFADCPPPDEIILTPFPEFVNRLLTGECLSWKR